VIVGAAFRRKGVRSSKKRVEGQVGWREALTGRAWKADPTPPALEFSDQPVVLLSFHKSIHAIHHCGMFLKLRAIERTRKA